MKKVEFYIDCFFEAGGDQLPGRYSWYLDFTEEEYEELVDVSGMNSCKANNWNCEWTGHEELFKRIDAMAPYVLNDLLVRINSDMANLFLDAYWELAKDPFD